MRVPWRDQPWDERLCANPLDNSSCLLLKNIGAKRDDSYEVAHALEDIGKLNAIPCLSERGTFMSPNGYQVTKVHPYATYPALKGHLEPTLLSMPPYSFEAVPFRWMARESFEKDLWPNWRGDYDPDAEACVGQILGLKKPTWIMDGRNQQSVIRSFFEPVLAGSSLVFVYLKHSPLQDDRTDRLLVGAAMIESIAFPGFWVQSGDQPFDSSMWETKVVHSLRTDQQHGVLLPYQKLIELTDRGVDVSSALAWVPDGRNAEFSFVTEHVSNDLAIDALGSLRSAAGGMQNLGIEVPAAALSWIDKQIHRLWDERGPLPGLAAVLAHLQVRHAHVVARELTEAPMEPWQVLEEGFADSKAWPETLKGMISESVGLEWTHTDSQVRTVYKLLSTMDVRPDQIALIMSGKSAGGLEPVDLLEDPYLAAVCTYSDTQQIGLRTVDRALFPSAHARWASQVPQECRMVDHRDWRRVRALMTDVLRAAANNGDTIVPEKEMIARVDDMDIVDPVAISPALLKGLKLDAGALEPADFWSPFYGAKLGDGQPAYKLAELVDAKRKILEWTEPRFNVSTRAVDFDAREQIDNTLKAGGHDVALDEDEEAARVEKAAGLVELFRSRISVLVGPAGTGKTTLLRALADLPAISNKGVLLLAPTGKASVQMRTKVGREARTLASFLVKKGGFDPDRDLYRQVNSKFAEDAGLVVIDEASMLTEEMLAATLSALGNVQRLVLVGDPRQLPPIGAGRPFVDLVNRLHPGSFDTPTRVAPSYVELTVSRRQGGSSRDDVLLAQWFGDGEVGAGADSVWERLRAGTASAHVEYRQWCEGDIVKSIDDVLKQTIDWSKHDDPEIAFKLSYGGVLSEDRKYLNWRTGKGGAGEGVERWQILSPFRSRAFGVVEINRHIKRSLRAKDLDLAFRYKGWRNPRPLGPEQIVRGDKVMQTRNDSRAKAWPQESGLNYVANGEIGVVVGRWTNTPRPPADVEFSSQVGATYRYWPSSTEDPPLELAWAVTVHKSQGSEFETTILVLPKRVRVSRELLYAALTRQRSRVVILHDGSVDDLVELAHPRYSETARRLTDLFVASRPTVIEVDGVPQPFDSNLIHVAVNGEMVRSKNEVIVADVLEKVVPGRWRYEVLLKGDDGTWCRPDFTISRPSGVPVYWEHLGKMNQPSYARRWDEKLEWYRRNGITPALDSEGRALAGVKDGPNGILVWTDDAHGVDTPAWTEMAKAIFGSGSVAEPRWGSKVARPS
ncbi:ATP-dependent RecD-like DNA helicase [Mycobacterium sp. 1245111.1]|uniref:ATP-dependent DNA helicase n=1 Tax=Mycobacterium sp. 1245111.1 TaxID=1834073 RepID=UPI0018D48CF2|nr:ATP-dependent RecD-like DNA helicase [Mycobacterium sp. 1245111.1]